MTPGPCQMCGADRWHPPWDPDVDPFKCKGCGNLVTPDQLAAFGRGHVRVLAPIDIPLGPKLELIPGGDVTKS